MCCDLRRQAFSVRAAAATSDDQKIRIKLRGFDAQLLEESISLITDAARSTGARVGGAVYLPTR
jgi:small subunit ribosomal protein S10